MATQALTLPLDITWQRFGYSADMIDTDFGNIDLPPKWRPSMTVYSYVVPEEQTAESYPNHRIIYLRLVCSITGWNPDEEIKKLDELVVIDDLSDDAQKSTFEAFEAGTLAEYAPCISAIAQIAVYPHPNDNVGSDEFPFIVDFEPKKRELYESRSETGEFLSGSSENINVNKGTTTVDKTERESFSSADVDFGLGLKGFSIGASQSGSTTTRKGTDISTVDMKTTDTSREKRESTSFSTTFNQMYQLFNGYHTGTNRAVFYMQARPHIMSVLPEDPDNPRQKEFNLVNGERKLEGLQDMFLVIQAPRNLTGLCVQANLDTGHVIDIYEFGDGPWEDRSLIVTRRIIQNCGLFSDGDNLIPTGVPAKSDSPWVVWEDDMVAPVALQRGVSDTPSELPTSRADRVREANEFNVIQQKIRASLLKGLTSQRYSRRRFEETNTFAKIVSVMQKGVVAPLVNLRDSGTLNQREFELLQQAGAETVADLYLPAVEERLQAIQPELLNQITSRLVVNVRDQLRGARAKLDN